MSSVKPSLGGEAGYTCQYRPIWLAAWSPSTSIIYTSCQLLLLLHWKMVEILEIQNAAVSQVNCAIVNAIRYDISCQHL